MVTWASHDIGVYKKRRKVKRLLSREEIIDLFEPNRVPGAVIYPEDEPKIIVPSFSTLSRSSSSTSVETSHEPTKKEIDVKTLDVKIPTKPSRTFGKFNFKNIIPKRNRKEKKVEDELDAIDMRESKPQKNRKASILSSLPLKEPEMRDRSRDVFDEFDTPDNRALRATFFLKEEHETVSDFLSDLVENDQPSPAQLFIINKTRREGQVVKQRHNDLRCSYPPNSVDEHRLEAEREHMLRYAWKGRALKMKSMLRNPAHWRDVNRVDSCQRTAAHFAASWGDADILEMLIDIPGIDLNMRDDEGKTPLYKATEAKSFRCVELLLRSYANPFVVSQENRTPFDWAIQKIGDTNLDIIKVFIQYGMLKEENKCKNICTALHRVTYAIVPVVHTASLLISAGVNPNGADGKHTTPLMLAANGNITDLVEVLLNSGADPNLTDIYHNDVINYSEKGSASRHLCNTAIESYSDLSSENGDDADSLSGNRSSIHAMHKSN